MNSELASISAGDTVMGYSSFKRTAFVWAISLLLGTPAFAELIPASLPMAGGTLCDKTVYMVTTNTTLTGIDNSALIVASNSETVIYIPSGVTLTCRGSNASSYLKPGQAGILVPKGSSLYITGAGKLIATGGRAGDGGSGGSGGSAIGSLGITYGGRGGNGGHGGAGAGAGIGTPGGEGGYHGLYGERVSLDHSSIATNKSGRVGFDGGDGQRGGNSAAAGDVYVLGTVKVSTEGGDAGSAGLAGNKSDSGSSLKVSYPSIRAYIGIIQGEPTWYTYPEGTAYVSGGDGGGGGGGGSGFAGATIGAGGAGGGGGGAGGGGGIHVTSSYNNTSPAVEYRHAAGGQGGGGASNGIGGKRSTYPKPIGAGGGGGGANGLAGTVGTCGNIYKMTTATLNAANTSSVSVNERQPTLACSIMINANQNGLVAFSTNAYFGITRFSDFRIQNPWFIIGKKFKGLYTQPSNGAQMFDAEGNANIAALKLYGFVDADSCWIHAQSVTLYAVWEDWHVAVDFDTNGGGVTAASRSILGGATLETLPVPVRNGYRFIGWFTSATGGTLVTEETAMMADMTLYAHWEVAFESSENAQWTW